jgi:Co/Zn/Cd efflux system component
LSIQVTKNTISCQKINSAGSGTMFSESLHSMADTINQSLLLIGVKRSERPATQENPYGFQGSLAIKTIEYDG